MKWLLSSILFAAIALSITIETEAKYPNFESVTELDGTLLNDFTSEDYKKYYPKVTKRKMFGWRVHYVHEDIKITYIKETLFSYYNDGYSAIEYDYALEYTSSSVFQIQATGTIGFTAKDDGRSFKNKLDTSLKISADYKTTTATTETIQIYLEIDPGTQVDLYVYGEGLVTNGVAARYFFWFRTHLGGYEWFEKTTEYQRLEKIKI